MRHGKKFNHLGRKSAHRTAMLANMGSSLIEHKRINTTLAKAKALRQFLEPIITKSKNDTTHNRRIVFKYLRDKHAVTELFKNVSVKIADRPGGYLRIVKLGNRLGDNAEMAMIEFVDYNDVYAPNASKKKSTRRGRRKKSSSAEEKPVEDTKQAEEVVKEKEPKAEVDTKVEASKSTEAKDADASETPKTEE